MGDWLENIYREHAPSLFRFLLRLTADESETREVLQDIFVRLAKDPHLLDHVASPRSYLFRLAHRLVIDRYRRDQTRRRYDDHACQERDTSILPAPELPAAWRAEILAHARREARQTRPAAWSPFLLYLRHIFARNPITAAALATLWALIFLFKTTTPGDPDAERMLLVHVDPSRPIYIVSLADQIRLAELLQDQPQLRPQIP